MHIYIYIHRYIPGEALPAEGQHVVEVAAPLPSMIDIILLLSLLVVVVVVV